MDQERVIGYKESVIVEIITTLAKLPYEVAEPMISALRTKGVIVEEVEQKTEQE